MKILIIHNSYGKFSGEEAVVAAQKKLLANNGHEVICFERSSADLSKMWFGELRAFFSGIYSLSSRKQIRKLLAEQSPDVVHIHNLFPLISPAILPECKKAGVPVVMTVHNYRLICPNGMYMSGGKVCEKCCGGKEYQCLLNNCEGSLFKSLGYFLRNWFARKKRYYLDNVSMFACLTEFQKQKLVEDGFKKERMVVVPNMVDGNTFKHSDNIGDYVGFVGRVSPEKGINNLISAAKSLNSISFKAAGDYSLMHGQVAQSSENIEFKGALNKEEIARFFEAARIIVLPSVWYEGFPITILEAMLSGKPVIASRIGGIPEIVDDGVTGLLFEPGNADDLAEKIRYLWDNPELCQKMGLAGREKAMHQYSSQKYYQRLMSVYQKAIALGSDALKP